MTSEEKIKLFDLQSKYRDYVNPVGSYDFSLNIYSTFEGKDLYVNVFLWVQKGVQVQKGTKLCRIYGQLDNPKALFEYARGYVYRLNNGESFINRKVIRLSPPKKVNTLDEIELSLNHYDFLQYFHCLWLLGRMRQMTIGNMRTGLFYKGLLSILAECIVKRKVVTTRSGDIYVNGVLVDNDFESVEKFLRAVRL